MSKENNPIIPTKTLNTYSCLNETKSFSVDDLDLAFDLASNHYEEYKKKEEIVVEIKKEKPKKPEIKTIVEKPKNKLPKLNTKIDHDDYEGYDDIDDDYDYDETTYDKNDYYHGDY